MNWEFKSSTPIYKIKNKKKTGADISSTPAIKTGSKINLQVLHKAHHYQAIQVV